MELYQWLDTHTLNEYAQDIARDLDIEINDPYELFDFMSLDELRDMFMAKMSTEEENAFAKDLMRDYDMDEESMYDDYTDGADDFSEGKEEDSEKQVIDEAIKLKEANETLLSSRWAERAQKVCEKYKDILRRDSISADEDLVEWAINDCCVRYNESRDNVVEMLNEARGAK